ncbi:MAG: glycosyltransferase family 39 protein [Chloroflexi bacterium]|nr:glycosyltransferase family 39 protein [Chloroflexota bacterium]
MALYLVSLILQLASLVNFWRDSLSNEGLALWLVSLGLFLLAPGLQARQNRLRRTPEKGSAQTVSLNELAAPPPLAERASPKESEVLRHEQQLQIPGAPHYREAERDRGFWLRLAAVGGVLLIALFMRVHLIDSVPGGLYLDEADNGLVGLKLLQSEYSPFTEVRDSNATLYFYLLGFSAEIFGTSAFALRLVAVSIGVLTVAVFYVLARRFFSGKAALAATFLLAVSRWHVNFSRIAFEAQLVPLFAALTAFFLLRGLQGGGRVNFALAGLFFGLGFHSYIGFRVFPLIILVFIVHWAWRRRPPVRSAMLGLGIFLLGTWMTLAPLGIYAAKNPNVFVRRMSAASVFSDVERQRSYEPILSNLKKSVLMFNVEGDPRPRHNLPRMPMLDLLTGAYLVVGVAFSLYRWRSSFNFLLLIWVLLGLMPGVFSLADSNPHSLRTIGTIPAVFLLTGVFWDLVCRLWRAVGQRTGNESGPRASVVSRLYALVAVPMLVSLALVGYTNYDTFFNDQYQSRAIWDDFDPVENAAGRYTKAATKDKLVFVSSALTNHSAVKFHAFGTPYETLDLSRHFPVRETVSKDVVYILEVAHANLLPELGRYYPGELVENRDRFGRTLFYTYTVNRDQVNAIHGLAGKYYRQAGGEFEVTSARKESSLQRRDEGISLHGSNAPLPPPFAAEWEGSLLLQRHGQYRFVLEAAGVAQLYVDNKLVVESVDGGSEGALSLTAGFHSIGLRYRSDQAKVMARLSWIPPGGQQEVIPPAALYSLPLAKNGLLGKYYRGNNWSGEPATVQIDGFIAPTDLLPAPFSIEWEGRIAVPTSGEYVFGTRSDDGSLLYVDDVLVVENGGHHGDRYVEGRVVLAQGQHRIRLRYFQDDGGRKMELWWIPPSGQKEMVPVDVLLPPE